MFNSDKKKIFYYSVIFVAGMFLIDSLLYKSIELLYSRASSGPGMYNYFISKKNSVIILGSSTAKSYYRDIFEKRLHISTLNMSKNGSSLIYNYCILQLLKHYNNLPDIVLLNVDYFEITKDAWDGDFYRGIESLSPLYGQVDSIDRALIKGKFQNRIKYLFRTYRYNNKFFSIIKKSFTREAYHRGFPAQNIITLPVEKAMIDRKFNSDFKIDQRKVELYEEIIAFCQQEKVRLILIESPVFYPDDNAIRIGQQISSVFRQISLSHNVTFHSFNSIDYPVFRSSDLFADLLHLNYSGGKILSEFVTDYLIPQIPENMNKQY